MNLVAAALDRLTHNHWRERDVAAQQLGDLVRGGALNHADAELAVTALVALLTNETLDRAGGRRARHRRSV